MTVEVGGGRKDVARREARDNRKMQRWKTEKYVLGRAAYTFPICTVSASTSPKRRTDEPRKIRLERNSPW
jgi:hypothetical protein